MIFKKSIPDIRWRKFRFFIDEHLVSKKIVGMVFWGFYESAEIRFVEKYLDGNLNVLELGGSIGILSSHIVAKLQPGKHLITVEANPALLYNLETNIVRHISKDASFKVLNYAISYLSTDVNLNISKEYTTTATRVIADETGVTVKARTMSSILAEFDFNNYALICDIEGSEIEILLNEAEVFDKCMQLFIELHDTNYWGKFYSVSDLKDIIRERHAFKLIDQQGHVFYFTK
jgi:FkbM family methyltransferase